MPNFKPKTAKKIKFNKKSIITIDNKHKDFLDEFSNDENFIIPELKIEKNKLKQKILQNNLSLEKSMEIKDKINEINYKIKNIKNKKKRYLLDNSKYIFEYFENKKIIESGINNNNNNNKSNIIKSFFKLDNKIEDNNLEDNNNNDNDNDNIINNENNNIILKYLCNVNDEFLDINNYVYQSDICNYCYKGELINDDGTLVCNNCSRTISYLIENEKPSYKEPPKEVCFYAYKRINHFKEILSQFQGKETTQIPDDVIDSIKLQIKKERIQINELSIIKTKEILKKLGYNKYYEHIPFIRDKLGIKPPVMSNELEESLCNLFIELQAPYSKYCPDNRVNFLNYYYTAYKLCELLGENNYLQYFPKLKDKDKIIEQDNIWKNICKELDWEFIPTL